MTQVTLIRDAIASDIPSLITIGKDLVSGVMDLKPDRDKIKKLIEVAISSKSHKLLVATKEDKIIGAMLTVAQPFMFAEKLHAYIVGVYSSQVGLAQKMVAETMQWVESRKAIQMCCYSMTIPTGLDNILLQHQFESSGSMFVWRRYGIL